MDYLALMADGKVDPSDQLIGVEYAIGG